MGFTDPGHKSGAVLRISLFRLGFRVLHALAAPSMTLVQQQLSSPSPETLSPQPH